MVYTDIDFAVRKTGGAKKQDGFQDHREVRYAGYIQAFI